MQRLQTHALEDALKAEVPALITSVNVDLEGPALGERADAGGVGIVKRREEALGTSRVSKYRHRFVYYICVVCVDDILYVHHTKEPSKYKPWNLVIQRGWWM